MPVEINLSAAPGYNPRNTHATYMQPAFRDKDRRASVALYITKLASRAPLVVGDAEVVELPVSSHSKPAVVAGEL